MPRPDTRLPASRPDIDSTERAIARAEFRKLALAQESFWAEKGTYASTMSDLIRFFQENPLLSVELLTATDSGWDARIVVKQSGLACLYQYRASDTDVAAAPDCTKNVGGEPGARR